MTKHAKTVLQTTAAVALVLQVLLPVSTARADTFYSQKVYDLFADTRPCVFFKLSGVSGNPAVPNDWFALSTSHPNFQTLNAYLTSSRLTNTAITVTTNTAGACGLTNVDAIHLF